jgi:hypothetical protein
LRNACRMRRAARPSRSRMADPPAGPARRPTARPSRAVARQVVLRARDDARVQARRDVHRRLEDLRHHRRAGVREVLQLLDVADRLHRRAVDAVGVLADVVPADADERLLVEAALAQELLVLGVDLEPARLPRLVLRVDLAVLAQLRGSHGVLHPVPHVVLAAGPTRPSFARSSEQFGARPNSRTSCPVVISNGGRPCPPGRGRSSRSGSCRPGSGCRARRS